MPHLLAIETSAGRGGWPEIEPGYCLESAGVPCALNEELFSRRQARRGSGKCGKCGNPPPMPILPMFRRTNGN